MKMLKPFSQINISNVQESINQFFLLHENIRPIESDLSKTDAEFILLGDLLQSFKEAEANPFEVN